MRYVERKEMSLVNLTPRKRTVAILAGLMLGMFFSSLNMTLVGTALPKIVASLGGMELYSWVITVYLLASTATVPVFGKLSDQYGRRPFYLAGLAIFMSGSALCGFSRQIEQLIIFRGLQGLGSGMVVANSMAVIGDIFPPAERGKWQGLMNAVFGLSSIIGPFLGGYLTDNLSWHWVFFVNLPVGFLALSLIFFSLPALKRGEEKQSVDYPGVAALVTAVVPLLLALSWGGKEYAWGSAQIIILFAVSALSFIFFVLAESRADEPVMPLNLFKNSIFVVSIVIVFLTGIGMFGTVVFIPLFIQGVAGSSATDSGLILTPMMLSLIVASTISGQALSRWGNYRFLSFLGLAVMGGGMFLLSIMDVHTTYFQVVTNMIVAGFGLGITLPLFVIVVQNAFEPDQLGVVTAAVQFFRSMGGIVGIAILGTSLNNRFAYEITRVIPPPLKQALGEKQLKKLADPQVLLNPQALTEIENRLPVFWQAELDKLIVSVKLSLALALQEVFLFSFFAVLVSFGVALLLKEIPLRKSNRDLPKTG